MSRTDDKYLNQLQVRYRRASKKERSVMLDEFVKTTGYHRKHAIGVLNGRRARKQGPIRRPRRKVYGPDVTAGLVILDDLFDHICSKLLRAAITNLRQGKITEGASTITMQLARIRFGINSRSIPGKLEQILRALQPQVARLAGAGRRALPWPRHMPQALSA